MDGRGALGVYLVVVEVSISPNSELINSGEGGGGRRKEGGSLCTIFCFSIKSVNIYPSEVQLVPDLLPLSVSVSTILGFPFAHSPHLVVRRLTWRWRRRRREDGDGH